MTTSLLLLTPGWPLLLALLVLVFASGKLAEGVRFLVLTAPLPALCLALFAEPDPAVSSVHLPALFLGSLWWLDEIRATFLLMTSLLWLLAGVYARGYLAAKPAAEVRRFELLWLLTLAGNLLLIIAEDVASFYAGFALMTFAGYGLVIYNRTLKALSAGRAYLYLAIFGEGFILAGLLGLAAQAASPHLTQLALVLQSDHASSLPLMLCILLGFGVKAGLPFLHVWLPVAHPVAPTPASAVLSGALVKAGLLGWLLILPLGREANVNLGQLLLLASLFSAFTAGLVGFMQSQAKAVLAYSTISQLGMMTSLVGLGLLQPELWPGLVAVLLVFVAHHGLHKGALFLAVGIAEKPLGTWRYFYALLLLLPPLALVGWFTSGTQTKLLMKALLYQQGWSQLAFWFTLAAVSTGLLMLRYLFLLYQLQCRALATRPVQQQNPWMLSAWGILVVLASSLPWWSSISEARVLPEVAEAIDLFWPLALAGVLAGLTWKVAARYPQAAQYAPPLGDVLRLYTQLGSLLLKAFAGLTQGLLKAQQSVLQTLAQLKKLQPWLLQLTEQELVWRREAALVFTLLLVMLAGFLLL